MRSRFDEQLSQLHRELIEMGALCEAMCIRDRVEVGAAGNSLDEALSAARLFAQGFAEVVTGKK